MRKLIVNYIMRKLIVDCIKCKLIVNYITPGFARFLKNLKFKQILL